jgi:hypothetical protein
LMKASRVTATSEFTSSEMHSHGAETFPFH